MAEELHLVDLETCRGDGICVDICPENVLEILDGKAATVESRAGTCMRNCQELWIRCGVFCLGR